MSDKKIIKIYLYTKFERFWHWLQALMIIILLITGIEIHGTFTLLGYEDAVEIHSFVGLSWLVLFTFFVFWLFTTGEWRQYVPTTKKLFAVIIYYSIGIFQGKPHPVQKSPGAKHNPLQRLTYLGLSALLLPVQMVTGLLYYTWNLWGNSALPVLSVMPLMPVALLHTLVAFMLLSFLLVHVYMTTTGHSLFSHISGMVTGWEEIYETTTVQEWELPAAQKH